MEEKLHELPQEGGAAVSPSTELDNSAVRLHVKAKFILQVTDQIMGLDPIGGIRNFRCC